MKHKSIFGVVLLLVAATTALYGQTFSIVGTGTTANTATGYPAPFGNYYWGARHQFLVTAAELAAAGVSAGASIQSLGFNVTNVNSAPVHNNFQILVYTTSLANPISGGWLTGAPAASTTPVNHQPVLGWNQFSFGAPFTWNGSDNLVVETCFNNSGWVSNGNASTQWTTTLSGATFSRWYRADASGVCSSTLTTSTSTTTRPNMRIGWVSSSACSGPLTPGSTVSTANPVCPGASFTLSMSSPPTGSGLVYQWQSSPDGSMWSDIPGATGSTHTTTQTAATWYQVVVTCTNDMSTATSTPLLVNMLSFLGCYCIPTYTSGTGAGDYISLVQLNGSVGSINNATGGAPAPYYTYYAPGPTTTTTLYPGLSYSITLAPGTWSGTGNNLFAWIDYDQSGSLSALELIASAINVSASTPVTINFTVPVTATPGVTRLRVREIYAVTSGDPCSNFSYGETEDYDITLAIPTGCFGMPNPGNTVSSANPVCPTVNFTLSLQNPPTESALTFQWQSSPDGSTWTDIAGATNPTHTTSQTSATWYQCVVTCTNTMDVAYSTPLLVNLASFLSCYCIPTYSSGTGSGDYISLVQLNGSAGSINNATGGAPAPYYTYYAPGPTTTTTLYPGFSYSITLAPGTWSGTGNNLFAWIDYDQSGTFTASELIASAFNVSASTSVTINFTVPVTATPGVTRLRVREIYAATSGDPCASASFGETEDYDITLAIPVGCSGMPNPGNTVSSANPVCSGVNFTLSLQNPPTESGLTFQWQSSPDGSTWTDIAGATNPTHTTSQTSATWYQCVVTCTNTMDVAYSTPLLVSMNPNFCDCYPYCVPTSMGTSCVTNVTLNTLNNSTSGCSAGNYSFQTASTTVMAGLSYSLSVTTDGSAIVSVWIDYNQDGTLDASEWNQVYTTGTSGTITVTIPPTATPGSTRMRIRSRISGNPNGATDACTAFGSGECEDYCITIIPAVACSGMPNPGNTLSSDNPVCSGANFTLSLQNPPSESGITLQWQSSPDGSSWTDIAGATNPTLTTSQTSATWYQCVVTCTNTMDVAYSTPLLVTMAPATACYCTPIYTSGTGSGDYIQAVALTGDVGGIANTTGPSPSPYYTFYAPGPGTTTTLSAGLTYSISLTPGSWSGTGNNLFAWIDYNQDGDFYDLDELIASVINQPPLSPATVTFTVPFSALSGTTRLRVREMYAAASGDPCITHSFGETEDYEITVAPADPSFTGLPSDICIDAAPVQLFPANPTATFSGPGIIPFGGDWYFDPGSAGVGTHTITCTVGSQSSSQDVTVHPLPSVSMCSLPDMCDVDAPVALTCGSPAGGIYVGTGVTDDGMGNYYFDPALAGAGTHAVIYLYTDPYGCSGFDFTLVNVNASSAWYADADGDSYGDASSSVMACTAPSGYVADNTDCDDTNPAVNPGMAEVCYNGVDDNCNGLVDENDVTATVSPGGPMTACGGVPITLNATASGPGTITYQWYRGFNPQAGATDPVYTTTKKGSFYVKVDNGLCNTISNIVSISRIPSPPANITNMSGTNDLCLAGGSITLKGNGTAYTYAWKKDGSYTGQTSKFVTVNAPGNYTVEVTNSSGCTTESAPVTIFASCRLADLAQSSLQLYPNPTDGNQVVLSAQLNSNAPVTITVSTLLGQEVLRLQTQPDGGWLQQVIDLPATLASGTYLVKLTDGNTVRTQQLVIQR